MDSGYKEMAVAINLLRKNGFMITNNEIKVGPNHVFDEEEENAVACLVDKYGYKFIPLKKEFR